jgi:alpha-L-fucosidase
MSLWIDQVYRRASVDMHIPDWDPAFLSKLDAETFAENLKRGGAQSHLQMCNSHAGQTMWQSKVGQPHKNMGSRDFIAELAAACKQRGIRFIAYFSVGHECEVYEHRGDVRRHRRVEPVTYGSGF